MTTLKVSAKTNPNSLAGALAEVIREAGKAELHKNNDLHCRYCCRISDYWAAIFNITSFSII